MRRFSLDSSLPPESGSLFGRRRGKRSKQIDSVQDAQLEIQKLSHSLNRDNTIVEESVERSDGHITNHSFVKHNKTFHKLFPEVPEGEHVTHTFTCSLQKEVLYHGKLFCSEHHICFHSSVLLRDTKVVIPTSSVSQVKKHKLPIPMLTVHTTDEEKYSLLSLRNNNVCYKLLQSICSHLEGASPNSSPHGSSAENEADHAMMSSYSSMDDSLDQSSNRNSISLDEVPQLSYGGVPGVLNSRHQNSVRAEEETEAGAWWVRRVTQRVASFVFPRVIAVHHVFFWVFLLLLVLLFLESGYIGLKITALEKQLNLLEVYFHNTENQET